MIKKLSLISLFTLLPASFYYAQTTVFAYVKDSQGAAVENASVDLNGVQNEVNSDKIGYFQFVDLKPGHYQIIVSKPNFETKTIDFDISDEKRKDLGTIKLISAFSNVDLGISIVDSESTGSEEEGNSGQSSTVGLLQSSRDVFSSIAGYDLGFYWFRPRGIDGRTGESMLNGISMSGADDGNIDFGTWGGLNEITRYPEIAVNHSPSEYAFGGIGSVVYKNTNAGDYRKGSQLTYSLTNRNYRNRLSYRYSSGMNKNGWAFTGMIARRWAQEGIQEGTFYDAISGYLGVEKKLSDNHTIAFNAIGSDYRRSTASPNTQEVFDLMGVHYNAYWGWQDGEKRSERVKRGFQPIFQLSDYWKINEKSQLWTTLSYQFGKDKSSRLDWFGVSNPSPTYYKNLPSFYQNSINYSVNLNGTPPADYVALKDAYDTSLALWQSKDPSTTQINWNRLYAANMGQAPVTLNGVTGRKALYYVVDDVKDDKVWNANTHFVHNFNDNVKFLLNVSYQNYNSERYREVKDLLGADFAVNMDNFAQTNKPGSTGQFNDGEADVTKRVGDKINYSYIFRRQEVKVNPSLKFTTGSFDVFVSALAGYTNSNREGLFSHYLYKSSYGKSADKNFWNYGLKGQITYRLNGRNFLVYNGAYYSQAPYLEDLYINPRFTAATSPNIKNTVVNANDFSYVLATPFVKARLTGFLIATQNETSIQRYFADGLPLEGGEGADGTTPVTGSGFVTQVMSNVDKRNIGIELGVEVKITPTLTANALGNYGQYVFRNNPHVYFASDAVGEFSNGRSYADFGEAALKNYKQGGTPQVATSIGLRYRNPKYWWIGANWNYLDNNYLEPAALTRTDGFIQSNYSNTPVYGITEDAVRKLLTPNKLPSAFFFNANAGKSWMIGKYYVMITGTVNNIFNNKRYITGGFEQTRNAEFLDYSLDAANTHPSFAPKYWYTQGRSYFVNLQFRF